MKERLARSLLASVAALFLSLGGHGAELTVAAAANFKFALDDLVRDFHERNTGTVVRVTYGSSGNFYAQLRNQAPFDLFLSADMDYPRKAAEAGLSLDTNVFLYAAGRLVVWVPKTSSIDVEKLGIQSLLHPSVKKIAIANPRLAPYGAAALAAMKSLKVHEQAEGKLVLGENIAQTAQFVQSGAADIGIIALPFALAAPMRDQGRHWEIPLQAYPRIEQGGLITKWTKHPAEARAFRDFILGEHGRAVLKSFGFFLPERTGERR